MDSSEKISHIGQLDPGKEADHRQLVAFISDPDGEVRYGAIERIGTDQTRETAGLLLAALDDPEELVRVQCLEELSYRKDLTDADTGRIRSCLDDESELVRRYAATALAAARDLSVIPLLKERLDGAVATEQVSYCFALATLGDGSYLDRALELLGAECYQARCSVANGIVDFVNDSNRARIAGALKEAWERETTRAARSSIEAAMKELGVW
jgi:HEAT repeat protein